MANAFCFLFPNPDSSVPIVRKWAMLFVLCLPNPDKIFPVLIRENSHEQGILRKTLDKKPLDSVALTIGWFVT
jgi:hypothetical protein